MRRMMIVQLSIMIMLVGMSMNSGMTNTEAISNSSFRKLLSPEKGGILRGVNFNMTKDEILQIEKELDIVSIGNDLVLKTSQNQSLLNEAIQYRYKFDKKGLFFISIIIEERSRSIRVNLINELKNHFNHKYSKSIEVSSNVQTWIGSDETSGLEFEILMANGKNQTEDELFIEIYLI